METYRNMNVAGQRGCRNQMNSNQACRQRDMQNSGRQNRGMYRGDSRSMEVECVCRVSGNDCHKEDPMEKLGDCFPVVMAYVPWQQWGDLYDADCGLREGTIFKDLNQIFCGVRC